MLIFTRRTNETLHIGDNTTVTVLGVKGNQVRIGVDAPKEIPVDRAEIRARKVRELQAMKDLSVFCCTFEYNGSTIHCEVAAKSDFELNTYLQHNYPAIDMNSLNVEVSWSPDLLLLAMSGMLDPQDLETYDLLRRTLRTYDNKTPCALLCRDIHGEAA
nr:carbon storage regulator CsrA [Marinobacterium stanieri]